MSDFIKEYWEKITTNKVLSAFIVLVVSVVIVVSISISKYDDISFLEGLLIEAHGMLLDILIIGVFILWLNRLGEKKMEVQRYKNEIDDFRRWKSDEAKFRIVGNIKRLNRLNFSTINLISCYLNEANLSNLNLQDANLQWANLQDANLYYANLQGANLKDAKLQGAILLSANLQHAFLVGAKLRGADLRGADLRGADITFELITKVKTLYKAKMDDELRKHIEENYPHLLIKPDWYKEKDE